MNGGHDLGGMHGLGPINPEPESAEPVFHKHWEKRVFALSLAAGFLGKWNIDSSRHARERQHPANYIGNSYYHNWLNGLETLLDESGLLSREEQCSGVVAGPIDELTVLAADNVASTLAKGGSVFLDAAEATQFDIGASVRVRNSNPSGHTRAPRYTRGKIGTVTTYHGAHIFADLNAHGQRVGQHLYGVRFSTRELWGDDTRPQDSVQVDLWESHLEVARI